MSKSADFSNFEIVMVRLKEALSIEFDKDMAALLEIAPATYSERCNRNSIPYEKVFEICLSHGIDINYIFGIVDEFGKNINISSQVEIKKYKNYKHFGDEEHAEPFNITNDFCTDPEAKLSAVVADNIYMFPVIDVGDVVIVNENINEISKDGKLFLVKYKGNVSVTRLFKCIDPDEVVMKFESPVQKDIEVKLKNLTILGKVASVHRSMV